MADTMNYSPYFLQTKEWSDFWLGAMNDNHLKFYLEVEEDVATFGSWVYKYPWHLNQCFLYVPKGPLMTIHQKKAPRSELTKAFRTFCYRLAVASRTHSSTYLKLDFDETVMQQFGVGSEADLQELLESVLTNNGEQNFPKCELFTGTKSLQYLQTMVLDGRNMQADRTGLTPEFVQEFYSNNLDFWRSKSQNIRRYTKKAAWYPWEILTHKDEETFSAFWQIYEATSKRQKFAIHSKDYFEKLFEEPFAHVIVLKNEAGEAVSSWLAVESGNTLVYLYGGNTQVGFKLHAQYMIHLTALKLLVDRGLDYYDLGGYDETKGFGKFKKGYRGAIRTFLGPVDIVLQPRKYAFTNRFVNTTKSLTGLFT